MALQQIKKELPDFYTKFLPDFFDLEIPVETFSTCSNCAMACHDENKRKPEKKYFSDDVKCCTYFPKLPNYLVGAILSNTNPELDEGRKRIREIIRNKIGVSPAGIYPSKKYEQLYLNKKNGFGNSQTLLCPYFNAEQKNCTIWKFREAACTTFFCKQVGGFSGKAFWTSLCNYLIHLQTTLVNHVLFASGYNSHDILSKFPSLSINHDPFITQDELEGLSPSDNVYKERWKHNYEQEEAFFINTFEAVSKFNAEDIMKLTGETHLSDLENKWQFLINIPQRLKINPVVNLQPNEYNLVPVFFNDLDITFAIPALIFEQFDGKKDLKEISNLLSETAGIEIDEEFILPFYQRGILIEANR
jgi:Fe-S-cluster containining protein